MVCHFFFSASSSVFFLLASLNLLVVFVLVVLVMLLFASGLVFVWSVVVLALLPFRLLLWRRGHCESLSLLELLLRALGSKLAFSASSLPLSPSLWMCVCVPGLLFPLGLAGLLFCPFLSSCRGVFVFCPSLSSVLCCVVSCCVVLCRVVSCCVVLCCVVGASMRARARRDTHDSGEMRDRQTDRQVGVGPCPGEAVQRCAHRVFGDGPSSFCRMSFRDRQCCFLSLFLFLSHCCPVIFGLSSLCILVVCLFLRFLLILLVSSSFTSSPFVPIDIQREC